jgi:hypothetical protein
MKLTHETESLKSSQSHSWSETSPPFMEPQFYYSVQKRPPLDRNAILLNSDHTLTFHFLKFLFYVVSYPHLLLGIPGDFVLQIFLLTFCINFPPIPCVLCVPPISYSLICCCRSPIFEAIYIFCPFPKNSFKSETLYSLRFLWWGFLSPTPTPQAGGPLVTEPSWRTWRPCWHGIVVRYSYSWSASNRDVKCTMLSTWTYKNKCRGR